MSEYEPDAWVIVKITDTDDSVIYKVLGGWVGGYLNGDSWQLNSGITKIEPDPKGWAIHGNSGSIYRVSTLNQRATILMSSVLEQIKEGAEKNGYTIEVIDIKDVIREV